MASAWPLEVLVVGESDVQHAGVRVAGFSVARFLKVGEMTLGMTAMRSTG